MLSRYVAYLIVSLFISFSLSVIADEQSQEAQKRAKFFANANLQEKAPAAFALQPQARDFLNNVSAKSFQQADKLVEAILADSELKQALAKWPELSITQQLPYLRKIFALECEVMAIEPPTLLIDTNTYPNRAVNFVFNTEFTGNIVDTGTVYLNPEKLTEQPHYGPLAFIIHETRHSYQYQLAQRNQPDVISQAYKHAFIAQKQLSGFSFSDFLTLNNEYEAFLFGNYVVGRLTNWQVDILNMGTYASQFDEQGQLKIDLPKMATSLSENESLLPHYNKAAEAQYLER
ncbi:hypothetical protein [Thalassotalea litorea]|uniref:hypothetical protein n=1 Tax=Thalassotalea litorea TaxID=2020715 RepID=UPI0037366A2F